MIYINNNVSHSNNTRLIHGKLIKHRIAYILWKQSVNDSSIDRKKFLRLEYLFILLDIHHSMLNIEFLSFVQKSNVELIFVKDF